MNPARNRYRLDVLNVSYHSPMMRSLHHATYTFEKRLSHTADSQDQRHRMVPASRPLMTFADTTAPDYITPRLIAANPRRRRCTTRRCRKPGRQRTALLALGVPLEFALYVLPNAKALRSDRIGLAHCAAAQVDASHVLQRAGGNLSRLDGRGRRRCATRHPRLGRYIGPPCVVRNGHICSALHRGHALLRRARLEQLSERGAPPLAHPAPSGTLTWPECLHFSSSSSRSSSTCSASGSSFPCCRSTPSIWRVGAHSRPARHVLLADAVPVRPVWGRLSDRIGRQADHPDRIDRFGRCRTSLLRSRRHSRCCSWPAAWRHCRREYSDGAGLSLPISPRRRIAPAAWA